MKLKGLHFAEVAKIQKAVTDELNKIQQEEFLQIFRNYIRVCIYANGAYFELNKVMSSSCVFDF
jgi:hypothetical protein